MIYRAHQLEVITYNQYHYMMKQISKRGWKTKEPEDIIYSISNNIFQDSIDLLFSENILSIKDILDLIYSTGVIMSPENLENLLNLKPGTLSTGEKPKNIIKLKI